jgi:hypothetical protein
VVAFSRGLVAALPVRHRLGRIAGLFSFVARLVDAPPEADHREGVRALLGRAGAHEGPAVILAALLLAQGERVRVECMREIAFVRIELRSEELAFLPPHAGLIRTRDRLYLPLDPRGSRSPLGFLPRPLREAMARRDQGRRDTRLGVGAS